MSRPRAALRLDEVSRGRDNNLNLVRLLAAVGVVYGHAFGIGDHTSDEPFFRTFGIGVGDVSVDVFFLISGFLITKSFISKNLLQFAWARAMRIYPALWASTIFLVLICGLWFSPLAATAFWSRHSTLNYLSRNVAMLPFWGGQINLPYAFASSVKEFNTPLWTLPYELQMYVLLALFGIVGWLRSPVPAAALAIGGACLYIAYAVFGPHLPLPQHARFVYFFFTGAAAYLMRHRIALPISFVLLAIATVVATLALTSSSFIRQAVLALVLPYALLWISFVPAGFIRQYNRLGDYSYGTYILACPIQVALALRLPDALPITRFALALVAVAPLAVLSWHGLEKRALALRLPDVFK